ncbi:MAG: peptidoglycan-binding protein LysM [Lutibacter sp.]|jgi:hypothetical protein|nr:peptidoglycan-binding protein LysM [Lutibacter sp.]
MKKGNLYLSLPILVLLLSGFGNENRNRSESLFFSEEISTVHTKENTFYRKKIPFLARDYNGFKEAVAFKESQGKYHVVNGYGYLGKYQFGTSTLERLRIYQPDLFLKNPSLQEKAFAALCSLNKWILRKDIQRSVGKKINGIDITESGILAAAHLAGAGNVKKFLRSKGQESTKDAYNSSIEDYMKAFAYYDTSFIKATKKPAL